MQRVLKHIKYLPEFGWNPIVLTVENGQYPARDESLLKQLPNNLQVHKVKIYEPYDIYRFFTGKKAGTPIDVNTIKKDDQKIGAKERIAEFIRATFFIPDARMLWLLTAKKAVREIIKNNKIDAVYSSSPPYTCSLIAKYASKKYNLPWAAGFRDPWTEFISSPKRWFIPAAIDKHLEHSVFDQADAVECAWTGIIKDAIGKYPDLDESKFFHVPNGFDSSDFPKIEPHTNEKFTITYTGSMYGRRNPKAFLEAVEILLQQEELTREEIKIKFIGRFGNEVVDMFNNCSFSECIENISYMPHSKSIEELKKSDALLLIVDESKESSEIVPGKVYEYVGVLKPIIAIAPRDSAIEKLMIETLSGLVAHQTEVFRISEIIKEYYLFWKEKSRKFTPDFDAVKKYERREASKDLSIILNNLITD